MLLQALFFLLLAHTASGQQLSPSMQDAYALLDFRTRIWNDSAGSLRNWYMGFTQDVCNWTGIECSSSKRVTAVRLSGLGLFGGVSTSLGDVSQLTTIDLSNNNFMGGIPGSLIKLKQLVELNLSYNMLQADIPPELGYLPRMKTLLLNNNGLYGPLPTTLSNLTLLTRLSVAVNILSGFPFQTLSVLQNLEFLDLSFNRFEGSVLNQSTVNWLSLTTLRVRSNKFLNQLNTTVGRLTVLEELDLSQNAIQGSIPPELGNCEFLGLLNLSFNRFSGAVPDTMGKLRRLTKMDLQANALDSGMPTGVAGYNALTHMHFARNNYTVISHQLSTLPAIIYVDISQNQLGGEIPVSIGDMVNVLILNFSWNSLSGNIPPHLSGCTSLQVLDLSHNRLTEAIPYTIIKMQSLEVMDLSANQLEGRLPEEFGSLTKLVNLDLSSNVLVGTIPEAIGRLPQLRVLDVSNNKLSGVIPANLMTGKFPAADFLGNADLCGQILNRSCTMYLGRTVSPGGMMVSAAALVCTMIGVMILTWWFCCRDDNKEQLTSSVPTSSVLRRFTAEAINRATEGFSDINFLGSTTLSSVYKGEISDGTKVAVKVLCPEYYGSDRRSFAVEAKMTVKVIHPNLVKVIGCCNSANMVALVLELVPNGSLERYLYGSDVCSLDWLHRLDIIVGVAEALAYMHHEWEAIFMCDLKTSSILLDEHLKAHITNFRLSSLSHVSETSVYTPPEYAVSTIRTAGWDVYSYGLFVLEIITRISPQGDVAWQGGLGRWVRQFYPQTLKEIIDPQIMGIKQQRRSILECIEMALLCTEDSPEKRPVMADIVNMLQRMRRSKELSEIQQRTRRTSGKLARPSSGHFDKRTSVHDRASTRADKQTAIHDQASTADKQTAIHDSTSGGADKQTAIHDHPSAPADKRTVAVHDQSSARTAIHDRASAHGDKQTGVHHASARADKQTAAHDHPRNPISDASLGYHMVDSQPSEEHLFIVPSVGKPLSDHFSDPASYQYQQGFQPPDAASSSEWIRPYQHEPSSHETYGYQENHHDPSSQEAYGYQENFHDPSSEEAYGYQENFYDPSSHKSYGYQENFQPVETEHAADAVPAYY